MRDYQEVSTRLAAVILLKRGEIRLTEIEALPFVTSPQEVEEIADRLVQLLRAKRMSRRRQSESLLGSWEDVIQLEEGPLRLVGASTLSARRNPDEVAATATRTKS